MFIDLGKLKQKHNWILFFIFNRFHWMKMILISVIDSFHFVRFHLKQKNKKKKKTTSLGKQQRQLFTYLCSRHHWMLKHVRISINVPVHLDYRLTTCKKLFVSSTSLIESETMTLHVLIVWAAALARVYFVLHKQKKKTKRN